MRAKAPPARVEVRARPWRRWAAVSSIIYTIALAGQAGRRRDILAYQDDIARPRGERMRLMQGILGLIILAAVIAGVGACGSGKKAGDAGGERGTATRLVIMATATARTGTTATPTAVPSPVASGTPGAVELPGPDGWRAFAALVSQAAARKDVDFFMRRAVLDRHECTAEDVDAGLLPCRQAGEVLEGIYTGAWRSEWSLVSLDYLRQTLERFFDSSVAGEGDKFGGGRPLLYALGEGAAAGDPPVFLAFVTAIVRADRAPERVLHVLHFVFVDDRWRLRADMFTGGPMLDELLTEDCLAVGLCARWQRWEG